MKCADYFNKVKKNPYWRHLFSRHKLRGDWITWSFGRRVCWVRIGPIIFRGEFA